MMEAIVRIVARMQSVGDSALVVRPASDHGLARLGDLSAPAPA